MVAGLTKECAISRAGGELHKSLEQSCMCHKVIQKAMWINNSSCVRQDTEAMLFDVIDNLHVPYNIQHDMMVSRLFQPPLPKKKQVSYEDAERLMIV